ncbi:MAG: hypothetical protein RLZZ184_4207, partial [Cyanobacteriota bacterium]
QAQAHQRRHRDAQHALRCYRP